MKNTSTTQSGRLICSAVLAGTVACLASCVVLPDTDTYERQINYAAAPLLTLADGRLGYLLQECSERPAKDAQSTACKQPRTYLAVRPADWDLALEARTLLSKPAYRFDDVHDIKARTYARPPLASHGKTGEFVGYFAGTGLIWVRQREPGTPGAATENSHLAYDTLNLPYKMAAPPALVVRDGDAIWAFIERSTPCNEDLCFSLPETLGLNANDLPENLRHSFMLYYQDMKQKNWGQLARVLPAELSRYLQQPVLPLPRPGLPYVFDFSTTPTQPVPRLESQLQCDTLTSNTEYFAIGFIPPHTVASSNSYRLKGCVHLAQSRTETGAPPAPPPPSEAPTLYDDDPPFARDFSSYHCQPVRQPGQAQFGQGPSGCGFILRAPKSGQALANTPYLIWLFTPKRDGIELEVKGLTDAQGHTAYIRSSTPLNPDRIRVSRRLLAGEKSMASTQIADRASNIKKNGAASGISLCCSQAVSGLRYRMTVCTGQSYEGITDDQAWTMAYDGEKGKSCPTQYLIELPAR